MDPDQPAHLLPARTGGEHQALQLASLASFGASSLPGVVTGVLTAERVNTMVATAALANNDELDALLGETSAYRHEPELTPARDFAALSSSSSERVAEATRRLAQGFLETRAALAAAMAAAMQVEGDVDPQMVSSFETVNASYAVVLSTVHSLFDNPDPDFRTTLRPQFLQLLQNDIFLKELSPHFTNLYGARRADAKKIALRTFFETFCEQAVEPTLYNERFSALVQAILLRELTQVIREESALDLDQRELAPYLASLFDQRMRSELNTAQVGDGEPQPILESFRECQGAANDLMIAVADFLIESSSDDGRSIELEPDTVISCEVMLSIGCLLPEIGLIDYLGKKLHQVADLNPALVLLFSSALKFSLHVQDQLPPNTLPQPAYLVARAAGIYEDLSDDNKQRVIAEIFCPHADEFVVVFSADSMERWRATPLKDRDEWIGKVLLRNLGEAEQSDPSATATVTSPEHERSAVGMLLTHHELCVASNVRMDLHPVALRWLAVKATEGMLEDDQLKDLIELTISSGDEADELALEPEMYEAVLAKGGIVTIEILASRDGHEERLCRQICMVETQNPVHAMMVRQSFFAKLVTPLRRALSEYGSLVTARQAAEIQQMGVSDARQFREQAEGELAAVTGKIEAVEPQLENEVGYIQATKALADLNQRIGNNQFLLEELQQYTPRELVEREQIDEPARCEDRIAELEAERASLLRKQYKLSRDAGEVFGKRSISLEEFLGLREQQARLQGRVDSGNEAVEGADLAIANSESEMADRRTRIETLFGLVQIAFVAPALSNISVDQLKLDDGSTSNLLATFCRISLVLQRHISGAATVDARVRAELESSAQGAIKEALLDTQSKPDTALVLNTLGDLVEQGAPVLMDWDKDGQSLAGFLGGLMQNDLDNPEMAWLSAQRGWDESMHGPLLRLFAAMLRGDASSERDREVKLRAAKMVYRGTKHWVGNEQTAREIERNNAGESEDSRRTVPERYVVVYDLYRPWCRFLQFTQAQAGRSTAPIIRDVTTFLVEDALPNVEVADRDQMHGNLIPLYNALVKCSAAEKSVLNPLSDSDSSFLSAVRDRDAALKAELEKRRAALDDSLPEAQTVQGLDSRSLSDTGILFLPKPKSLAIEGHQPPAQRVITVKGTRRDTD